MRIVPRGQVEDALQNDLFLVSTNYYWSCVWLTQARSGEGYDTVTMPALNLLMGFTLELSLKAVLRFKQVPEKEIADVGHNLLKAFRLAREHGYTCPDPRLFELCKMMAKGHKRSWWRYLPDRDQVKAVKARGALPVIANHLDAVGQFLGMPEGTAGPDWVPDSTQSK